MAELDDDYDGQNELINPFATINNSKDDDNNKKDFVSPPNTNFGPNYEDEDDDEQDDEDEDDDDLNDTKYKKPPKRIKELDDSGDELEENERILQSQFKQNFNNLFADKRGLDKDTDVVVQEEIGSKEYNKEHGEQKMEPFNLKEERGEGYFDQYLNYHKTKSKETDPFWQLLDEDKEKDEALFNKKYQLSDDIVRKHKEEYDKFENANTEINVANEWKSLLPLFENNTQTITQAMQSLSKVIRKHDKRSNDKRPTKKRKLNQNSTSNSYEIENNDNIETKKVNENENENENGKKKTKRKKRKRTWEIDSDDENKNENGDNDKISARELMGYKRKFELFSEKATMLMANGDHNIYEQTRDSLIQRIKLVEDEELFKRQQREAIELKRRIEQQQKQKKLQQQLQNKPKSEKEKLDDMLADFDDDQDDEEDDDVDMEQDNDHDIKSNQNERVTLNETDLIWSYYWKNDETETIHGPFTCKQMSDWNETYFKAQPIMFKNKNDNQWLSSDKVNLIERLKTYSSSNE